MNRAIVHLQSNCNQAFQNFSMDQCFRIGLGMLFLVVYLQANPIPAIQSFNLLDLGLNDLLENVTCKDNVTFTSPTNVPKNCDIATLMHFMEQLEHAQRPEICTDDYDRINDTLTAFGPQFTSVECELETKRSEFKNFVNDIKTFVERINQRNAGN